MAITLDVLRQYSQVQSSETRKQISQTLVSPVQDYMFEFWRLNSETWKQISQMLVPPVQDYMFEFWKQIGETTSRLFQDYMFENLKPSSEFRPHLLIEPLPLSRPTIIINIPIIVVLENEEFK